MPAPVQALETVVAVEVQASFADAACGIGGTISVSWASRGGVLFTAKPSQPDQGHPFPAGGLYP
jgi:hypothetical protein